MKQWYPLLALVLVSCGGTSNTVPAASSPPALVSETFFASQQSVGVDSNGSPVGRLMLGSFTSASGPMSAMFYGTRDSAGRPLNIEAVADAGPGGGPVVAMFDPQGVLDTLVDQGTGDLLIPQTTSSNAWRLMLYDENGDPLITLCESVSGGEPVSFTLSTNSSCAPAAPQTFPAPGLQAVVALADDALTIGTSAYIAQEQQAFLTTLTASGLDPNATARRSSESSTAGIDVGALILTIAAQQAGIQALILQLQNQPAGEVSLTTMFQLQFMMNRFSQIAEANASIVAANLKNITTVVSNDNSGSGFTYP